MEPGATLSADRIPLTPAGDFPGMPPVPANLRPPVNGLSPLSYATEQLTHPALYLPKERVAARAA